MEKMQKRQLPSLGGTAKKKKGGEWESPTVVDAPVAAELGKSGELTPTKCMKFTGGDYLRGFIPNPKPKYTYDEDPEPELIPEGALLEHRPHFSDIWFRYDRQVQSTNGMDLDTYPGSSMVADLVPVGLFTGSYEDNLMRELVNLALEIYNKDESNVFEYRFLKIEKANFRLTGYLEFFMTVKFLNVTLGTVMETFQIYAGRRMGKPHLEVFSCVPKAGALV